MTVKAYKPKLAGFKVASILVYLLRLTQSFTLTPDPLDDASDYTISKPADQGSSYFFNVYFFTF